MTSDLHSRLCSHMLYRIVQKASNKIKEKVQDAYQYTT
jgi:hypothetical protein